MGILFLKKKMYYLLCILAVLAVCLAGDLVIIDEEVYSVFRVIWESPAKALNLCDMKQAFDAGVSGWFCLLLPVASLPFASYLSDERKSGLHLYVKGRQGSFRYLHTKLFSSFASSTVTLVAGLGAYILTVAFCFPLNPHNEGTEVIGAVEVTVWGLCGHIAVRTAYFLACGMALSMLMGLFVCLYNDLCVDFCLVFLFNYLFSRSFDGESFIHVFLLMVVTGIAYTAVRWFRRDWL